ncbi:hypothetical protein KBC31_01340 [Candidatus Saccharibacteria bacterium]|nr:hypothetical protein [Candidatus Saccharibacteria bacterium]
MTHKLKVLTSVAIATVFVAVPLAVSAQAASDTKSTTINAVIASTISMTTSGNITFNITPTGSGAQSNAADTVTVATNNSSGYNLKLSDADAATTLLNTPDTLTAHAGTLAAPTALANGTWGYHLDGAGGMGTGGAVETNLATSTLKYAGVKPLATPDTIKTTAAPSAGAGDVSTVYYGAKVDTSKKSGTYTGVVTYTATTNP